MRLMKLPVYALLGLFAASCMPSHLRKYQEPVGQPSVAQDKRADVALLGKQNDADASGNTPSPDANSRTEVRPQVYAEPPTIYMVGKDTYHLNLAEEQVWDSLVSVLLKNYNLTLVSREQGLVTTEWDSYHLNNVVYRNKVSARLVRSRKGCELTIHNNVEQLTDNIAQQSLWLPGSDGNDEGLRIVKNIAILLRQPPPQAPPGNVARDVLPPELELP